MDEKTKLVIKLLHLAYLVQAETKYCVFLNFYGHVDQLEIRIAQSKEEWHNTVLQGERTVAFRNHLAQGDNSRMADLRSACDVLEAILRDGQISYDALNYEEEYARFYEF